MNKFARGAKIGAKMTSRREPDRTMRIQSPAELQPRDVGYNSMSWGFVPYSALGTVQQNKPK